MSSVLSRVAFRAAIIFPFALLLYSERAQAGASALAGTLIPFPQRSALIERVQYHSYDGDNYCWYDDGWQGPGWYWCGDEWLDGFGWGGGYGWNGWGGGYIIRPHRFHGLGVWRRAPHPTFSAAPGLLRYAQA